MPEVTNVSNMYLIIGHVEHDDDDVRIVESDQGLGHAKLVFKNYLANNWYQNLEDLNLDVEDDEIPAICITCARHLTDMMEAPIREDANTVIRVNEVEDDNEVLPGW